MSPEEIALMKKENEEYSTRGFGRWSWFAMIDKLSLGDITKHDQVCEQNFVSCLNLLSYWKERDAEQKRMEDNNKQNKR